MNRAIHHACRMVRDGKSLADVRAYLKCAPIANCVFQEAWHAALTRAKTGPRAKELPPPPRNSRTERVRKMYRAERRNIKFFRPDVGNCTPATRF